MDALTREIVDQLSKPFPVDELRVRVGATSGEGDDRRGLAIAYIDARCVMDRLDEVVGPANWTFTYEPVAMHDHGLAFTGKLTVLGTTRMDIGEAAGEGEAYKSVVSDTLKRCAVGFGIGRYLYRSSGGPKWFPIKTVGKNSYFKSEEDVLKQLVAAYAKVNGTHGKPDTDMTVEMADLINDIKRQLLASKLPMAALKALKNEIVGHDDATFNDMTPEQLRTLLGRLKA